MASILVRSERTKWMSMTRKIYQWNGQTNVLCQRFERIYKRVCRRVCAYKSSFFPSTIRLWKSLPVSTVTVPSLDAFAKLTRSLCSWLGPSRFRKMEMKCHNYITGHARIQKVLSEGVQLWRVFFRFFSWWGEGWRADGGPILNAGLVALWFPGDPDQYC